MRSSMVKGNTFQVLFLWCMRTQTTSTVTPKHIIESINTLSSSLGIYYHLHCLQQSTIIHCNRRAKGELITPATWIRRLVETHPSYQHDSIITQEIAYDVLLAAKNVGEGNSPCPEILGDVLIDRLSYYNESSCSLTC